MNQATSTKNLLALLSCRDDNPLVAIANHHLDCRAMRMNRVFWASMHKMIVATLRSLPTPLSVPASLRINRMLENLKAEYLGTTYFGARIFCQPKDLIQAYVLHFGIWEPEVSRVIETLLAPGDVFVDVGANVGYDTLLGSWRVGPAGKVVAIEATPHTFALLQRNLAQNDGTGNVRTVQLAVSDKSGALDLYQLSDHNIGATSTLPHRGGRHVATVTAAPLTEILQADELSRVRLVKIDVEGGEAAIFCDILDNLARFPFTADFLVEISPEENEAAWREIFARLKAAGFHGYEIMNRYDVEWYLSYRRPTPLRLAETLPDRQQDMLFTRGPLPQSLS